MGESIKLLMDEKLPSNEDQLYEIEAKLKRSIKKKRNDKKK
jgi:hypothetical protein